MFMVHGTWDSMANVANDDIGWTLQQRGPISFGMDVREREGTLGIGDTWGIGLCKILRISLKCKCPTKCFKKGHVV